MTTDTDIAVADEPVTTDWFDTLPVDWPSWLTFRARVTENPRSRRALRDFMLDHLGEDKHLERGLGMFAAGEPERALEDLTAADGDLAKLLAGYCQMRGRNVGEAAKTWAGLTKSKAVGARACLALAELHMAQRDAEALAADGSALSSAGGSDADAAFVEGLLAELDGDHDQALACWEKGLESDPTHVEMTFRLAALLNLHGDEDSAFALLEPFRTGALPAHTGALINLGLMYEDREQNDWAVTCFHMVVTADPTDVRARRYLTDAEASLDQFYDEGRERRADKQNAVLRIPVTDFELSVRARNCLQKMNIHTLGDLVGRTESDLLSFKNFGETSLQEVKEILVAKGLRLGMLPPAERVAGPDLVSRAPDGDVRMINISELDLSVRSRAALATLGLVRVGDLVDTTETTLLSCKNFGQTSLDEIRTKLRHLNLELGG